MDEDAAADGALFGAVESARWIAVPGPDDDKYSRGVVGLVTGSSRYPGAAVLGVEAALRTGVGMLRYLGSDEPQRLVLQRRPEAVVAPGRVQAWVVGSGQDAGERNELHDLVLADAVPVVLDGGALELHAALRGRAVLTPHAGELARVLGVEREEVEAEPTRWAREAAARTGSVVLLKGHSTRIASPDGSLLLARSAPAWLATAGAGDALAGILGALLATHEREIAADPAVLAPLAATAAVIHGLAARRASGGGPFTVLDLCESIPAVVAGLVPG